MLLLDIKRDFSRIEENQHFYFQFLVKENCSKITIDYSYSPIEYNGLDALERINNAYKKVNQQIDEDNIKRLLPLKNLITIAFDGPQGLIGNAHRFKPLATYSIGPTNADYGFKPCRIIPGLYRISLSAHCIASEKVTVAVVVRGEPLTQTLC